MVNLFHCLIFLQWAVAKSNEQAIFQQKLAILFVPQQGPTPGEEVIQARRGLLGYLKNMEALDESSSPDMEVSDANKEHTYLDLSSRAKVSHQTFVVIYQHLLN